MGDMELLESTGKAYGARAMYLLSWLGALLGDSGLDAGEPHDMSDDTWRWAMVLRQEGLSDVDIAIEMPEAVEYDGEPGDGLNFGLDVTAWGGRVLGGVTPYNFTDAVWVRASKPETVLARWEEFETAVRGYGESGRLLRDVERAPATE